MIDLAIGITILAFFVILTVCFIYSLFLQFRNQRLAAKTAGLESEYLRLRVDQIMDVRKREKAKSELSWNGLRKFCVQRKVKENKDICSFYLVPHDGKPLPPFFPGQYLTFEINVPETGKSSGAHDKNHKPIIRCYSLSVSPTPPAMRTTGEGFLMTSK